MNLAPVRGSYLESYCGASPAHDMRPFQGQSPATLAASALKGQPVRPDRVCVCNFKGITLQPGENIIEVEAKSKGGRLSDRCTWTLKQ